MLMTHEIAIELINPDNTPSIQVKQGDTFSRQIAITLTAAGVPWSVPEGTTALIRYRIHPLDFQGDQPGIYDTLSDGSAAWSISENTVTITLVPQMLACHSLVWTDVVFLREEQILATCNFEIYVNQTPADGVQPQLQSYYRVASLSQINEKFEKLEELLDAHTSVPCVRTINGAAPDENGNIAMSGGNILVTIDPTLSQTGQAADAKAVGDRLKNLDSNLGQFSGNIDTIGSGGIPLGRDSCGWCRSTAVSGTLPTAGEYSFILQSRCAYGAYWQTAVVYPSNDTYSRMYANSQWTSWVKISA